LVIVPDGPLHRLPFGALRPEVDAEPLAVSYETSIAPSASIWVRLLDQPARPSSDGVISLADPEVVSSPLRSTRLRGAGSFAEVLDLPRLPRARQEARAVVRALGKPSLLAEGSEASERLLKSSAAGAYGVVHLAVHAVIDEAHPRRSSLVLAPGDDREDGLLQMHEIVGLNLEGKTVILSACSSASGRLVAGEGVMGLARSFFQSGATAVIASLWPLRDDEAQAITNDLAGFLGRGDSVAASLAQARREAIRQGMPAGAWAGFVALGNAERPVAGGTLERGEARPVVERDAKQ
jgi:CHAT domain-containing protein